MLSDYTNKELIVINPDISDKKELFEKMVNHVYNLDLITHYKDFRKALWKREEVSNTELIPEIALPHARSASVEKIFLCIVLMNDGLHYDNPDLGDVKIVFFMGVPEGNSKEYLQLLAKSSRLLKNEEFKERLLSVNNQDEVLELLNEYDTPDEDDKQSGNYLMIVTVYRKEIVDEAISALAEAGITSASVINASSVARKIAYEMPVFAGLSYMSSKRSESSAVFLCHLSDKNSAMKFYNILKSNSIDLNKSNNGFIQLIKTETLIGNPEEDIEL
ncbi:MAG: hypothetical protein CSB55_07560 [Candidatus Cloacimonadota bacterium]|nr:MAG: hypothetical protein CSB55_07560 [Candidatus Cloacimonadota bacterium]